MLGEARLRQSSLRRRPESSGGGRAILDNCAILMYKGDQEWTGRMTCLDVLHTYYHYSL